MKNLLFIILFLIAVTQVSAQRKMEKLDRGLIAYKVNGGVMVTWRVLGEEWKDVAYNLYKEGVKLNQEPITGGTNFIDPQGGAGTKYSVSAVVDGIEMTPCPEVTALGFSSFDIPLDKPSDGTNSDGAYTYSPNDCSVGDLDGDGDYEIIVKWDPSNSKDNSQSGITGNVYLDAYHLDGTKLWRIDLGRNIRAGAHYTQFMVFDFDGDGKAEVACKTADGTIDGAGTVIGSSTADYRSSSGYILSGPEFLTIFNGETGAAMNSVNYAPSRGTVSNWGDNYGNRVDRFLACVAYLDGVTPSLVMCRGYYTRTTLAAWEWNGTELKSRWIFDTDVNKLKNYTGQGDHSVSVADVDFDGKDEIIYGSCTIDDNGTGLYTTGLGHGDALHVSDFDALRPGLEVFNVHESGSNGASFRDAATGEIIWQKKKDGDTGRGLCANVSSETRGAECWAANKLGVYDVNGSVISSSFPPINFAIWWDGDDNREILDNTTISKWNVGNLLQASGCSSNNSTKSTPNLSADIFGDWREEVIFRTSDNTKLRVFMTPYATDRRLYTLMHDSQYRLSIAWQNVAYNQPPHTSFYFGEYMAPPPPPLIQDSSLVWNQGNTWDVNQTENWLKNGSSTTYQDNEPVSFDIRSHISSPIELVGNIHPKSIRVNQNSDITFQGGGTLSGTTDLIKLGKGKLNLNGSYTYSGKTSVWQGSVFINGQLGNSPVVVMANSTVGGKGDISGGLTLMHGATLTPGSVAGQADTLKIGNQLTLNDEITVLFDLSDEPSGVTKKNDQIIVEGDLTISGENTFVINLLNDKLEIGSYKLVSFSGTYSGDLNKITVKGALGVPYRLVQEGNSILLKVDELRDPDNLVWDGTVSPVWNLATDKNWKRDNLPDWFVTNDTVLFNDQSKVSSINLDGLLVIGEMRVDASKDYSFSGTGSIAGAGNLVKNGTGKLNISTQNQYTGSTMINQGILIVSGLTSAGEQGPLGASTVKESNLIINGGKLLITGMTSESNRNIDVGANGAEIEIDNPAGNLSFQGKLSGSGTFTKSGRGKITISGSNNLTGPVIIREGNINLVSSEANASGLGSGEITIENASLTFVNGVNSYDSNKNDFNIPDGASSTIELDGRCAYSGSLTGAGTLTLYTPYVRSELVGDWSEFSGTINVTTDSDGGTFLLGDNKGLPNATVSLSNSVDMIYRFTENAEIEIGELTGGSGSELGAGGEGAATISWKIGGKNSNFEFVGKITDAQFKDSGAKAALIKTGSGKMGLQNSNTYSGGTIVEAGNLNIKNSTGSGTGSGLVTVKNKAVLSGNGAIKGPLVIETGGGLAPGETVPGTLTVSDLVSLNKQSLVSVKLDPSSTLSDKIVSKTGFKLEGCYLFLSKLNENNYEAGKEYKILDAAVIEGNFSGIIPSTPGAGLQWDTSELYSNGILKIASATGLYQAENFDEVHVFPNPFNDVINIQSKKSFEHVLVQLTDQTGRTCFSQDEINGNSFSISTTNLKSGIYNLSISSGNLVTTFRIIKT